MKDNKKTVDLESLDKQDEPLVANDKTHNMTKGELQRATDDAIREIARTVLFEGDELQGEMKCHDIDAKYHSQMVDFVFRDCEDAFWQLCIQKGCPLHRSGIEEVVDMVKWDWSYAVDELEYLWNDDDDDDDDDE